MESLCKRRFVLAALLSSSTAALQNFGMKNPFANKKDGASVLKLQLAFRVGAGRGQGTVLGAPQAFATMPMSTRQRASSGSRRTLHSHCSVANASG